MLTGLDWSKYAEVYHRFNSGVYGLVNRYRDRVYVGCTFGDFLQRWQLHRSKLERGVHENRPLQRDWRSDGGKVFTFLIFQELSSFHKHPEIYEQFWLDGFRQSGVFCYNSNHPITPIASAKSWNPPRQRTIGV